MNTTVLMDNSAFHSAARCCEGKARRDSDDVPNLLQFATLAVYTPKVAVSGYELDFKERADAFHERLKSAGLHDVVNFQEYNASSYARICRQAARSAGSYITNADLSFKQAQIAKLPVFSAASAGVRAKLRDALIAKNRTDGRNILQKLIGDDGLPSRAAHSVVYMLLQSDALFDGLREQAGSSCSHQQVHLMSTWLKIELNHHLAHEAHGDYVPADARAKAWESQNTSFARRIDDLVRKKLVDPNLGNEARNDTRPENTGLPVVSRYLVEHSNGDPLKLLDCARVLREKASLLRRDFERIAEADPLSDRARRTWTDLERALDDERSDSGLKIVDAFTCVKIWGIPVPLPNRSFVSWWKSVKARRRVTFLVNLAFDVSATGVNERTLDLLRLNCTKNQA